LTLPPRICTALKGNSSGLRTKAVAYIRTSSAANVGAEKDSDKRQRHNATRLHGHARLHRQQAYIASNGARTVIVETPNQLDAQNDGH
jgi:hypothetical protein